MLSGSNWTSIAATRFRWGESPFLISQYRRALVGGEVVETQRDGWAIAGYRDMTVPFMGDYGWLESARMRVVEDVLTSSGLRRRGKTMLLLIRTAHSNCQSGFASFSTSRNVAGPIYTARMTDRVPYAQTPDATMASADRDPEKSTLSEFEVGLDDQEETRNADALDDLTPGAGFCAPAPNPGPGVVLGFLNNRTKNFDAFGAVIEDVITAHSTNPTKSYNIPRSYGIVVENETTSPITVKLNIPFQPVGAPLEARASFDQLPFDPAEFPTAGPPATMEIFDIDAKSSAARPVSYCLGRGG